MFRFLAPPSASPHTDFKSVACDKSYLPFEPIGTLITLPHEKIGHRLQVGKPDQDASGIIANELPWSLLLERGQVTQYIVERARDCH